MRDEVKPDDARAFAFIEVALDRATHHFPERDDVIGLGENRLAEGTHRKAPSGASVHARTCPGYSFRHSLSHPGVAGFRRRR